LQLQPFGLMKHLLFAILGRRPITATAHGNALGMNKLCEAA